MGHSSITDIRIGVLADKYAKVAWPHVELAVLERRLNPEDLEELFSLLQSLVMAAHVVFSLCLTILDA